MPNKMDTTVTIVIPVYEMEGWENFMKRSLATINAQTYKEYNVVIVDNSEGDNIHEFCKKYSGRDFSKFYYTRHSIKGASSATNSGIKRASGDLIKILHMDDYFSHQDALKDIVEAFTPTTEWLVTGCLHDDGGIIGRPHQPHYNDDIHTGKNTIGAPSVLTIRNHGEDTLLFDEKLRWLFDCDYYKRLHVKFGNPSILNNNNVIIGLHRGQATHLISEECKKEEDNYMKNK